MVTKLQKYVLEKMLRKRVIGAKHIGFDTIVSGVASHELGELKEAIEELIKEEYLIWYDKSRKAIQLNKHKLQEIKDILINQ